MVHLNPVVMLEEQPTATTAAVLLFEQPGPSCADVGVSALSRAPVDPVPIIGTAVALDLDMPRNGHLAMGQQVRGIGVRGRGGKGETGAYAMPVPPDGPGGGFPRVSPACPVAEFDPGEVVKPFVDGVAHADAVVVGPPPDDGVELADQRPCGRAFPRLMIRPSAARWSCPLTLAGLIRVLNPRRPWPPGPLPAWYLLTRYCRMSKPRNANPG